MTNTNTKIIEKKIADSVWKHSYQPNPYDVQRITGEIMSLVSVVQSTERAQTAQDIFDAGIDTEDGLIIHKEDYYELKLKYLKDIRSDHEND